MYNTFSIIMRCTLGVSAFVFGLVVATPSHAAGTEDLGQLAGTVSVPSGLDKSDVQEAIVMTLAGRQWGIKSKAEDRVVGYLKHRSNEATVTLIFDTTKVDVYCVGWKIDKKTGVREKPEQPKGWLKNIQGDLTKNLNKTVTHK